MNKLLIVLATCLFACEGAILEDELNACVFPVVGDICPFDVPDVFDDYREAARAADLVAANHGPCLEGFHLDRSVIATFDDGTEQSVRYTCYGGRHNESMYTLASWTIGFGGLEINPRPRPWLSLARTDLSLISCQRGRNAEVPTVQVVQAGLYYNELDLYAQGFFTDPCFDAGICILACEVL